MFEGIMNFLKKVGKKDKEQERSKDTAKERLHLVLMQDRANVSADFLDMMRQEIVEVIKKYIDVDEKDIDVRLTNKTNEDGTTGAPALYANIPITGIKEEIKKEKEDSVETEKIKDEMIENKEPDDKKLENKSNQNEKTKEKNNKNNKLEDKSNNPKEQKTKKSIKQQDNEKLEENIEIRNEDNDNNELENIEETPTKTSENE